MLKKIIVVSIMLLGTNVYANNFSKEETISYGSDMVHTYLHTPTNMTVKWIENKDKLATFTLGVKTPTTDSTGVNHIIEHTLFTGSGKFPSGTLFFDANANYPHTYMNASTAADYTMYPFQTPYKESFYGLLEVYLDSILNPNMLNSPHSFYEESFYYDPQTDKYGGVVYNEMKGASTTLGRILYRAIRSAAYEDTHYQNDSGGDINEIPTLTYKQFVETYKNYYYPQNMMIALYGEMDISATLDIIDNYLVEYMETKPHDKDRPSINVNVEPTLKYENIDMTYSIGAESSHVIKSFVLQSDIAEEQIIELDLWLNTYILDLNSTFRQNLSQKGIEQMEIFKDQDLKRPIYSIIISQVAAEDMDYIKQTLDEEIQLLFEHTEQQHLEQDTLNQLRLDISTDEVSTHRGLDITHSIISNWVHDKDLLGYYKANEYVKTISDIDEQIGKQILKNASPINITLTAQEAAEPIDPLTISCIEQHRWPDIVTNMRAWQKAYDNKVLEATELKNMILGDTLKYKDYKKDSIHYNLFYSDANLLSTEFYLNSAHIKQKELPYLFLYSYVLNEVAQEITPFEGTLNSKIVALENKDEYTPYQKIEILSEGGAAHPDLLKKAVAELDGKDEEWFNIQLDKIVSEFYSTFQNDIIGTLTKLTNGAQSGYKRYIYEAHYPFYKFVIECKKGNEPEYISLTKSMSKKLQPTDDSSIAIIGQKKDVKQAAKAWREYVKENKQEKVTKQDYDFRVISKDSVYYKKGQVDYLVYNYDTKKDYVEAIDYLLAAYATKNYLQPEIRIKKGAYGSGMQVKFPNSINIYTYRDPHYKSSIDIIEEMAASLDNTEIDEKLRMAKSEALSDFQTQFGLLGSDFKKASILHAINIMQVDNEYIENTQKDIINIDEQQLLAEIDRLNQIVNESKKGVCIKKGN